MERFILNIIILKFCVNFNEALICESKRIIYDKNLVLSIGNSLSNITVIYDFSDISEIQCNVTSDFIFVIPRQPVNLQINKYMLEVLKMKYISLYNYKGILLFETGYQFFTLSYFSMYFSNLDFYFNDSIINSNCSYINFLRTKMQFNIMYKKAYFSKGVKYSNKYCVEIFDIFKFELLNFGQLTNTFLRRNYFNIIKGRYFKKMSYYPVNLYLEMYQLDITSDLLNENLFKKLEKLVIQGTISFIEANIFRSMELNHIIFNIDNLRQVLHKSSNILNFKNSYIQVVFLNTNNYDFQDQDYCVFKRIFKVVNFVLRKDKNNCSCTLKLLIYSTYSLREYYQNYINQYSLLLKNNNVSIDICFDYNMSMCNYTYLNNFCTGYVSDSTQTNYAMYLNFYNIGHFLNIYEFISQIIFLPFLSIIGIFLSIFSNKIVLIILSKKESENNLFKFLFINNCFNICYCIMMLLKLTNKCIINNGIYCPSYYKTDFVQYFDIYIIKYSASAIKLSSCITEFLISYSRLQGILSKKVSNPNNRSKFSYKNYFICILLISLLISLVKKVQYKINYGRSFIYSELIEAQYFTSYDIRFLNHYFNSITSFSFPYDDLDKNFCKKNDNDSTYVKFENCSILKYFLYAYYVLADLLLFVMIF